MRPRLGLATLALVTTLAILCGAVPVIPSRAADGDSLPGMASVSGTVRAPRAFKTAQVRLMNTDKNVLFMVYTSNGRYRAVNLLPGNYEVTVRARGLEAEPQ